MLHGFGKEKIDWTAANQQLALIQSLYAGSQSYAQGVLDVNETLVSYVRNRDTWPPSWLHVQRGSEHWVVFEGSTNNWQITGHVPGVWMREDFLGDASVNGGWWDVSRTIKPLLGDLSSGKWHFSGHSYGGAVAAILALELAEQRGSGAVELMTFGTPLFMTNGYHGPLPKPYWRIEATTDLVPALPPNGVEIFGTVFRSPLSWLKTDWFFWEYGDGLILNSKGEVNGALYDPDATGDLNVIGFPQAHYVSNYWGRLNARGLSDGDTDPGYLLSLAYAREGFRLAGEAQQPAGYQTFVYGPSGEPVPIPTVDNYSFGGAMADAYYVNLVFTGRNQATWREGHTVLAVSAVEATTKLNNNTMLSARAAFLSSMYTIALVEAVNMQNPRDGVVRTAGVNGAVANLKGETAGVACSLGYSFNDNTPQRWAPVRGFPDGSVKWNADTGTQEFGSGVAEQIRAWVLALNGAGAGALIRTPEAPGTASLAKNYIVSLDGNTTPGVTIVTCSAPVSLGTAKQISVHLRGDSAKKALPGMSGTLYPVISSTGSTVTIPYTIPRGGSLAPGEGAYMRPAVFTFKGYSGAVETGRFYGRRTRRMK